MAVNLGKEPQANLDIGPDKSEGNVTTPESLPESDLPLSASFISLGEKTSFAEWDYTVINVEFHNVIQDSRPRGEYVVFIVEVTNNAKMSRQVSYFFELQDDQGRYFDFDSGVSLDHHQAYRTDSWHLDDIGPSFSAVMAIAFDVPNDVKRLFLYPIDMRDEDLKDTAIFLYELDN